MTADDPFWTDEDGGIEVDVILVDFRHADHDVAIVSTRECYEAVRAGAGDSLDERRDFRPIAPAITGRSHFRGYDQLCACLSRPFAEFEKLRRVAILLEQSRFKLDRGDLVWLRYELSIHQRRNDFLIDAPRVYLGSTMLPSRTRPACVNSMYASIASKP